MVSIENILRHKSLSSTDNMRDLLHCHHLKGEGLSRGVVHDIVSIWLICSIKVVCSWEMASSLVGAWTRK